MYAYAELAALTDTELADLAVRLRSVGRADSELAERIRAEQVSRALTAFRPVLTEVSDTELHALRPLVIDALRQLIDDEIDARRFDDLTYGADAWLAAAERV